MNDLPKFNRHAVTKRAEQLLYAKLKYCFVIGKVRMRSSVAAKSARNRDDNSLITCQRGRSVVGRFQNQVNRLSRRRIRWHLYSCGE